MAAENDDSEKYGWWTNELKSLGFETKKINQLNDLQGLRNLTKKMKQTFFQGYKTCYDLAQTDNKDEEENCMTPFKL